MVPFPLPEVGEIVHQAWLLVAVHAPVPVTAKLVDPAAAATFWLAGVTVSVQPGACVTVTFIGLHPATETLMVATRVLPVVFAE